MSKLLLVLCSAALALLAAGPTASFAPASCSSITWRLGPGPPPSEKTGQHTGTYVVTNSTQRRCVLMGYPRIRLFDRRGRRVAFTYSHRGDQMITARRPKPVSVRGHGSVYFAINKYRCDIRAADTARVMRVLLPGARRWLQLRLPRYPIIDYCPGEKPSTTIAVSPLVKALADAASK